MLLNEIGFWQKAKREEKKQKKPKTLMNDSKCINAK